LKFFIAKKPTKQAGILIKSKVILYMQYTSNQLEKKLKEMRNEKTKLMIRVLQIHMVRAKGTRKKPRLITTGPYNITTSENKIDIY